MKKSILSLSIVTVAAIFSIFLIPCHVIAKPSLEKLMTLAAKGDAEAQYALARKYFEGDGVKQNPEEALKWTQKAAKQGYAPGQNGLGVLYLQGKGVEQDYAEAHQAHAREDQTDRKEGA